MSRNPRLSENKNLALSPRREPDTKTQWPTGRQARLGCTHEAESIPFQTQYFSDNLVAPGIEPGPLDL
jgi:hypothetical protein